MTDNDIVEYAVKFSQVPLGLRTGSLQNGAQCVVIQCTTHWTRKRVAPCSRVIAMNHKNEYVNFEESDYETIWNALKQKVDILHKSGGEITITFRIHKKLLQDSIVKRYRIIKNYKEDSSDSDIINQNDQAVQNRFIADAFAN